MESQHAPRSSRARGGLIAAVSAFVAAALGAAWYFDYRDRTGAPATPSSSSAAPAGPIAAEKPSGPRYPIDRAPLATDADQGAKIPSTLADSDAALRPAVVEIVGRASFDSIFQPNDLIRRFVATVDNLPRRRAPQQTMPVKPVAGRFVAGSETTGPVTSPANAARYLPYVILAEGVDARRVGALYLRFYPLFEQAYHDLGYPAGHFNDRLVATIDDLLMAPDVAAPIALVQPKILYQYVDADLEALSAGQKVMIRMGAANAAKVKAALRRLRAQIAAGAAPGS